VEGTPGANDNASGIAALLALARYFARSQPQRTLRLVAFANEEPPFFQTEQMGSLVYARRCAARHENVVAMLSLETMGYYSDAPNSQHYPFPFSLLYPSTGNFLAFVGNLSSQVLTREAVRTFRRAGKLPAEGAAVADVVAGIGWSDHWSFWRTGVPAVMVTDTAPYRYAHYHEETDTPEKLDYDRLARAVVGLADVIEELSGGR
jgi:Zn-dependent M28 family amino/carboxypeptidase